MQGNGSLMKPIAKWALLLIPVFALAMPASAFPPAGLSDSGQPGSVIVYPKFVNSLFGGGSLLNVDGNLVSQTEIEVGAVCPPAFAAAGNACPEHMPVTILFHWVCPGAEGVNSNICPEEDFVVNLTVPGKATFSADGTPINSNSPPDVPAPPCARGYLYGSAQSGLYIAFNGLIGNAVIRNGNLVDGTTITGTQIGDVRFDKTTAGAPLTSTSGTRAWGTRWGAPIRRSST